MVTLVFQPGGGKDDNTRTYIIFMWKPVETGSSRRSDGTNTTVVYWVSGSVSVEVQCSRGSIDRNVV